jgi:hypothetical protein
MLIGILIPIVINSFTEFGIFGESNYGIIFYQIIIFSIAFRNNNHLTRVAENYSEEEKDRRYC